MPDLPTLYLISDRHQILAGRKFLSVLEELLKAGVKMLQLREKDLSAAELLPLALKVRALTSQYGCMLFINDRIDVAQAVAADGVHLGGHSLPPAVARNILGPDKLIGVSTHSPEEVDEAELQGADFVTFGPIFHTASKAAYGAPVGLENLKQVCSKSKLPIYGLGGIKTSSTAEVINSGAYGVALISALFAAESPVDSCRELHKILC